MELLSSNSFLMMEKSMGFLWAKQAAILDNISNAETPNLRRSCGKSFSGRRKRIVPERRPARRSAPRNIP